MLCSGIKSEDKVININVIGLNELQGKLSRLPQEMRTKVSATLEVGAQTFVRNAKRDAPVNFGVLRNLISYAKTGELTFEVISGAKYSPYLEWGTITKVSVPEELVGYAIQFKGRGIRKSGGISPRPYFFPQVKPTEKLLNESIPKVLDEIKL